jgi:hypothetical protein
MNRYIKYFRKSRAVVLLFTALISGCVTTEPVSVYSAAEKKGAATSLVEPYWCTTPENSDYPRTFTKVVAINGRPVKPQYKDSAPRPFEIIAGPNTLQLSSSISGKEGVQLGNAGQSILKFASLPRQKYRAFILKTDVKNYSWIVNVRTGKVVAGKRPPKGSFKYCSFNNGGEVAGALVLGLLAGAIGVTWIVLSIASGYNG